jgi:YhcH/YjgK/YiaL family protein
MAVIGSLTTVRAQVAPHPLFKQSFAYLDECLRVGSPAHTRIMALKAGDVGRIDLGAGLFALEQAYMTKSRAEGKIESHRKHIDIQVIITGEELMETADIARLTVSVPYSDEKDVMFYSDFKATSVVRLAGTGETAVYYPVDAHIGSLAIGAPAMVRKVVVKVPV